MAKRYFSLRIKEWVRLAFNHIIYHIIKYKEIDTQFKLYWEYLEDVYFSFYFSVLRDLYYVQIFLVYAIINKHNK